MPKSQSQRLVPQLISDFSKIKAQDHAGLKWSKENYPNGYTSYSSMDRLDLCSNHFADLKIFIDKEVKKFVKKLELDLNGQSLQLTSLWGNEMFKNSHHSFHLHPKSVISGTFYLNAPSKAGALKFEDPRVAALMSEVTKKPNARLENKSYVSLQPKVAQLVLFESWLKHEVMIHRGSQPRLSLSFNYGLV